MSLSAVPPLIWTLQTAAGSLAQYTFTFTVAGSPYPIDGATWEYVVRVSPESTGVPLLSITTTASADGVLTVTSTQSLSQVALTLHPAATAALAPITYSHALWMNPGTDTAFTWVSGSLALSATPQP